MYKQLLASNLYNCPIICTHTRFLYYTSTGTELVMSTVLAYCSTRPTLPRSRRYCFRDGHALFQGLALNQLEIPFRADRPPVARRRRAFVRQHLISAAQQVGRREYLQLSPSLTDRRMFIRSTARGRPPTWARELGASPRRRPAPAPQK